MSEEYTDVHLTHRGGLASNATPDGGVYDQDPATLNQSSTQEGDENMAPLNERLHSVPETTELESEYVGGEQRKLKETRNFSVPKIELLAITPN